MPVFGEGTYPYGLWYPYSDIHRERIRAHALHHNPPDHLSQENLGPLHPSWPRVVGEEFGEVCRVLNDYELGEITHAEMLKHLKKELTQLSAMSAAWLESASR